MAQLKRHVPSLAYALAAWAALAAVVLSRGEPSGPPTIGSVEAPLPGPVPGGKPVPRPPVFGESAAALADAWNRFETDPADRRAVESILGSFAGAADQERQEHFLKRAVAARPNDAELVELLAYTIFGAEGRYQDGIDFFTPLLALPTGPSVPVAAALAAMHAGLDHGQAAVEYARVAAAGSEAPQYELHLGKLLVELGRAAEAEPVLARALAKLEHHRAEPGKPRAGVLTLEFEIKRAQARAYMTGGDQARATDALDGLDRELERLRSADGGAELEALYDRIEARNDRLRDELAH